MFTRSFSSVHKHSLIASRCIPHAPCIVQSQLAGCVSRQLCDNATEEKFEDRLVYVVRRLADQRKMKEGILDDVIALMRDAVAQGHDSNPDHNEELEARMEKLGDTMLYVAGMFLIMVSGDLFGMLFLGVLLRGGGGGGGATLQEEVASDLRPTCLTSC